MDRANKVAQITVFFWLMKVVATTLGETLGDFLSMTIGLGYLTGLLLTFGFFLLALLMQVSSGRYIPAFFWLAIIATTTLGTEVSDFIDRSLHLGYVGGSLLLVTCLGAVFLLWFKNFGSLGVYPVVDKKRELFYWMAILFSNSLGTAFGDFLSDVVGLSYLTGALVTAGIIVLVLLLHYLSKLNTTLLFWVAFVFTRPFGATFGDFLTKPTGKGGLKLGTAQASVIALALMAAMVIFVPQKGAKEVGS